MNKDDLILEATIVFFFFFLRKNNIFHRSILDSCWRMYFLFQTITLSKISGNINNEQKVHIPPKAKIQIILLSISKQHKLKDNGQTKPQGIYRINKNKSKQNLEPKKSSGPPALFRSIFFFFRNVCRCPVEELQRQRPATANRLGC